MAERFLGLVSLLVLLGTLGACAAKDEQTEVNFVWADVADEVKNFDTVEEVEAENAFAGKTATGLVSSGFCYALNINAPDLTTPGTAKGDTCETGVPGLGAVHGPYPYGVTRKVLVKSGSSRRFDLIGFRNPFGAADPNCSRALEFKVLDDTANNDGSKRVDIYYGGVQIDTEFAEMQNKLFLFGKSQPLNLVPGTKQDIVLNSLPWTEEYSSGEGYKMYPSEYGCRGSAAVVGIDADPSRSSVPWPTTFVYPATFQHMHIHFFDAQNQPTNNYGTPSIKINGAMAEGVSILWSHHGGIDLRFSAPNEYGTYNVELYLNDWLFSQSTLCVGASPCAAMGAVSYSLSGFQLATSSLRVGVPNYADVFVRNGSSILIDLTDSNLLSFESATAGDITFQGPPIRMSVGTYRFIFTPNVSGPINLFAKFDGQLLGSSRAENVSAVGSFSIAGIRGGSDALADQWLSDFSAGQKILDFNNVPPNTNSHDLRIYRKGDFQNICGDVYSGGAATSVSFNCPLAFNPDTEYFAIVTLHDSSNAQIDQSAFYFSTNLAPQAVPSPVDLGYLHYDGTLSNANISWELPANGFKYHVWIVDENYIQVPNCDIETGENNSSSSMGASCTLTSGAQYFIYIETVDLNDPNNRSAPTERPITAGTATPTT